MSPVDASDTLRRGFPVQASQRSYSHRGDRIRRSERISKILLVGGLLIAVALIPHAPPSDAEASSTTSATSTSSRFSFGLSSESRRLRAELDAARGELQLAHAQLERVNSIMGLSARFKVSADLATDIYDVALSQGIEPELGFRLVRVESQFNPRATSSAGAIGLTQVIPSTARYFDKTITRERLYEPRTNLRLGFRYLRTLIDQYNGDLRLALLVYNRGPLAVETLRSLGVDPANGYETAVMKGYNGTGVVN
jgi:soluble lytic murein transglycosylase-like protein